MNDKDPFLFGESATSTEDIWNKPLVMDDFLKAVDEIEKVSKKVMPYAFVMSVYQAKTLKKQIPAPKGPLFNFLGLYGNGMSVFALSNKKFKEVCEKEPELNDVNKVFIIDNPLALDMFMVKHNITEWAVIEEEL